VEAEAETCKADQTRLTVVAVKAVAEEVQRPQQIRQQEKRNVCKSNLKSSLQRLKN
jgi:hypothetical protein